MYLPPSACHFLPFTPDYLPQLTAARSTKETYSLGPNTKIISFI
jgi:hypothetical protein